MGVAGAIEINKLQFVRQLLSLLGTFDTKLHKVWINRKGPLQMTKEVVFVLKILPMDFHSFRFL